ncbi:MAG: hypothetical protein IPL69_20265 [Saprospiraceae bacterium]|nr:hypothetical protein [Candidatus Brachybacter algidus]
MRMTHGNIVQNTTVPDTNWRNISFNDGTWSQGTGGIGFGDAMMELVATCISVYTRKLFNCRNFPDF